MSFFAGGPPPDDDGYKAFAGLASKIERPVLYASVETETGRPGFSLFVPEIDIVAGYHCCVPWISGAANYAVIIPYHDQRAEFGHFAARRDGILDHRSGRPLAPTVGALQALRRLDRTHRSLVTKRIRSSSRRPFATFATFATFWRARAALRYMNDRGRQ